MKVEDRRSKVPFYTFADVARSSFIAVNNETADVAYRLGFDSSHDFIIFVCNYFGEHMSGKGLANLVLGYISRATLTQIYNLISWRSDLVSQIDEQIAERYKRTVLTERNIRKEPCTSSRAKSQLRALGIVA